jgi:hypothetical protein
MDNNSQNLEINKEQQNFSDVDFIEVPKKNCKKCGQNKKKKCRTCESSKKKLNWMLFLSLYFFVFIIWGHIELFKLLKSFISTLY